jgi:hypothetical protein
MLPDSLDLLLTDHSDIFIVAGYFTFVCTTLKP